MRIEERLAYPGAVNLYGLHGVGKTFLGWTLAAEHKAIYVAHESKLQDIAQQRISVMRDSIVIIDNASEDRAGFRRTMVSLESLGDPRAVVITNRPVDDYVFGSRLDLTEADIQKVKENLESLGFRLESGDWRDLWHGLLQAAGVHYHGY